MKLVSLTVDGVVQQRKTDEQLRLIKHFDDFHGGDIDVPEFIEGVEELLTLGKVIVPEGTLKAFDTNKGVIKRTIEEGGTVAQITLVKPKGSPNTSILLNTATNTQCTFSTLLDVEESLERGVLGVVKNVATAKKAINYLVSSNQEGENLQLLALPEGVCFIPD